MSLSPEPQVLNEISVPTPNPVNALVDYKILVSVSGDVYFKTNPATGGVPVEIEYYGTVRLRAYDYDTGNLVWGSKVTPDFTVGTSIGTSHKVSGLMSGKIYALYCRVFSSTSGVDNSVWFKLFDFQVPSGSDFEYDLGDLSPFP